MNSLSFLAIYCARVILRCSQFSKHTMIFNSSVSLIYLDCLSLPGPLVDVYYSITINSQGIRHISLGNNSSTVIKSAVLYLSPVCACRFTKQSFFEVRDSGSFLFIWAVLWVFSDWLTYGKNSTVLWATGWKNVLNCWLIFFKTK